MAGRGTHARRPLQREALQFDSAGRMIRPEDKENEASKRDTARNEGDEGREADMTGVEVGGNGVEGDEKKDGKVRKRKANLTEVGGDEDDIKDGKPLTLSQLIKREMGFSAFKTTQNKKVDDNYEGYARVFKKREYRQYMNTKKPKRPPGKVTKTDHPDSKVS